MEIDLKINGVNIEPKEVSAMHVNENKLTIMYGMGHRDIEFDNEPQANEAMEVISQVADLAIKYL